MNISSINLSHLGDLKSQLTTITTQKENLDNTMKAYANNQKGSDPNYDVDEDPKYQEMLSQDRNFKQQVEQLQVQIYNLEKSSRPEQDNQNTTSAQ